MSFNVLILVALILLLIECNCYTLDDWRNKLEEFRSLYNNVKHNHFHLLDTDSVNIDDDDMHKDTCPEKFPNKIPTLKDLPHICSNLDTFNIYGNCNIQNCSKCMPPGSESMPWVDQDIIPFFHVYDETLSSRRSAIQSLLSHIDIKNKDKEPILLMVFNYGYSFLFFNWICGIEYNNIETTNDEYEYGNNIRKHTIIITTDEKAKNLVESKGFIAYYPEWLGKLLKRIDSKASDRFASGPHRWTVSIQIATLNDLIQLGYNVILQDSDIVWYKNPIPYLTQPQMKSIDIQMSVDERMDNRGPGNSGFFIIRSNCKTKMFMSTMMSLIVLVIVGRSDQVLWNVLIDEKIFRQMHFQTLPTKLFIGGQQVSIKPSKPKTKKQDLPSNHFIVHVCWTTDQFDKIEKLANIDQWYFSKQKCPNHFDQNLLPDLADRKWYIRDKSVEQERLLKQLGFVRDSTNGNYSRPQKKAI